MSNIAQETFSSKNLCASLTELEAFYATFDMEHNNFFGPFPLALFPVGLSKGHFVFITIALSLSHRFGMADAIPEMQIPR